MARLNTDAHVHLPRDTRRLDHHETRITVNLERVSRIANGAIVLATATCAYLGHSVSFYFHFLTVALLFLVLLNFYWRHIQKEHTLLANFGFLAQVRYLMESVGPEFRQYWFSSDTEERPFTRVERAEVYRKAKGIDSSSAFGSQKAFDNTEIKLRHSMYPLLSSEVEPFSLTFGEERGVPTAFTVTSPIMISAMSFGSLGEHAVRALARGARKAGAPMNTGEGGYPKHHLREGADLIFQMGTAKFGVRDENGGLDDKRLADLARLDQVKMVEIKFSQGAKPGKGGLLPKEKMTQEIAELRNVPFGKDVVSPPSHLECVDAASTVRFIRRVQEVSGRPVGIKMCFGRDSELRDLLREMRIQRVWPDYISIDGGEGGTGAAPKAFMDSIGMPLFHALPIVQSLLVEEGAREHMKLIAAGKLVTADRQLIAMSLGANLCYSARGFLFALGCIQALQCNQNTCPVGITTHDARLQSGLDIELKSERVRNYVHAVYKDQVEILAALGARSRSELTPGNLFIPQQGAQ